MTTIMHALMAVSSSDFL